MILLIDNSHNTGELPMKQYLKSLNYPYTIITDILELDNYSDEMVKLIILSGGPMLLTEKEYFSKFQMNIKVLLKYTCPIIGICFGFQIMCMAYGGILRRLQERFCQEQIIHVLNSTLFKCKDFEGYFCCNDILEYIPSELEPIAYANINDKNEIVAVQHKYNNHIGLLFHPEKFKSTHYILDQFIPKNI